METQPKTQQKTAQKYSYHWLMRLSKQSRTWITGSVALGVLSGLLLILQASILARVIDRVYLHHWTLAQTKTLLIIFLASISVRAILSGIREWVSFKSAALIQSEVRLHIMQHLFKLGPMQSRSLRSGALSTTLIEQVEALHDFFAYYLPQMSLIICIPIAILAFVFPINWVSGFLLLLTAPLIPLFMALIGMGAESVSKRHFQSLARLSSYFLDTLQGLSTLKLFGRSKQQADKVYSISDEYRERTMSVLRIAFMSSGVLELFSSVVIAMLAVYLGLVLLGQVHFGAHVGMSLQHALFILLLAPEFYLPLRQLAIHYHAKAEAVAAAGEIQNILALEPTQYTGTKKISADKIMIECDNIRFNYPKREPLLYNVNFTVHAGEHVAIIGPSGSGKSTLLHLMMNLLQPTEGVIRINRTDLKEFDQEAWLHNIAWIGQNTRLFPGTVRENIMIANPAIDQQTLERAVQLAHINQFADDLDMRIAEGNSGLSGGQVQRIALARAFIKDAPLLLLDEPTASLDKDNERLVLDSLNALMQGRTVITVSHRENTISNADRIFKLSCGVLTEHTVQSAIQAPEEVL